MIRKAEIKDLHILSELACQLWPDNTVEEMRLEFSEIITKNDAAFFLAYAAVPGSRMRLWKPRKS